MRVTIGKKLIWSTICMLILLSTVAGVGIWSVHRVEKGAYIILRELSFLGIIQELRLSFEKVLMPAHDYLIQGDKNETQNFEYLLDTLKKDLARAQDTLDTHEGEKILEKKLLWLTQKELSRIETSSRLILSSPDPLGLESAKTMKNLDTLTDTMQEHLDTLSLITSQNHNLKLNQLSHRLMLTFQRLLMPVHDYLIEGSPNELITYRQIEKILDSHTALARRITSSSQEKEIMAKVEKDLKEIKTLSVKILNIPDPLKTEVGKIMKEMDKISHEVIKGLDSLLDLSRKNAANAMKIADHIQSASTITLIGICLIIMIVGLTGGILFARGITEPIKKLVKATQKISAGDLDYETEVSSKDEIEDLADSFNLMTEDLREYRNELIHAQEYINNILKSMIDTLIVITPDGKIQTTNQATLSLLGYAENELIGQPVEKIFTDDNLMFSGPRLENLIQKESVRDCDLTYKTKESKEIPVNFSGSVMKDKQGKAIGIVGVGRDMRELRKLIGDLKNAYQNLQTTQAQLVQSSKLASLGVLSAGIAHEISNPINVIINYAGLLEDEMNLNEETSGYVQGILQETRRVNTIIKNIFTFARQEKSNYHPVYLVDTIDSSLAFTEGYLLKNGIQIIKSYKKSLPLIYGNNNQLIQVFVNLIINAHDALNQKYPKQHPNKRLQITADQIVKNETKYVRIIFHDTGIGIAEEDLDKIFDPFYTTKQTDKGCGLGLSISYGIIKDHQGTIVAASELGEYTAFMVDLPISPSFTKALERNVNG